MQRSFVVTIDDERFNAFKQSLSSIGIPQNLFPRRFIGYEITEKFLIDNFKIISDLQFSPIRGRLEKNINRIHAICNNASHFAIVQHAMLLDWPFVTIFEDDATPVNDCIEKINEYCKNVPDNTDVLRLGYAIDPHDKISPEIILDNFVIHHYTGSHAYVVFKKFFRRFLDSNKHQPRCDYDKINPTPDKVVYALKESLFNQKNLLDRPVIHSWKLGNGKIKLPPVH